MVWNPLFLDPSDGVFGRFDLAALCGCRTFEEVPLFVCLYKQLVLFECQPAGKANVKVWQPQDRGLLGWTNQTHQWMDPIITMTNQGSNPLPNLVQLVPMGGYRSSGIDTQSQIAQKYASSHSMVFPVPTLSMPDVFLSMYPFPCPFCSTQGF